MKARTQILIVLITLVIGTAFVLWMKNNFKPTAQFDDWKTVKVFYVNKYRTSDHIAGQEREEDGKVQQRIVRVTPGLVEEQIREVDIDTLNFQVWIDPEG